MQIIDDQAFLSGLREHRLDIKAAAIPAGVRVERDVCYGETPEKPLLLDLYDNAVQAERIRPALVFIHGGGFVGGNKRQFAMQAAYMALRYSFVCVCISYRFSQEAPFPAAIDDVISAVHWLRSNAEKLDIDPQRIVVVGGSAGGYLAAMTAIAGEAQLCIALNGVLDFYSLGQSDGAAADRVKEFMGGAFRDNRMKYREASPVYRSDSRTCPMLLLHGEADSTIPCEQSRLMARTLREAGAQAELVTFPGKAHGWFNKAPDLFETLSVMEEFVMRRFGH